MRNRTLFVIFLLLVTTHGGHGEEPDFFQRVKHIDGTMENSYTFGIQKDQSHRIAYSYKLESNTSEDYSRVHMLKIKCSAEYPKYTEEEIEQEAKCPLWIKVWQGDAASMWKVSAANGEVGISNITGTMMVRTSIDRSVCLDPSLSDVNVELFTCSDVYIRYTLNVKVRTELKVIAGEFNKIQVTALAPAIYYYQFAHNDIQFAYLKLSASGNFCMIMSIQHPQCPVADTIESAKIHGQYQSFTIQAAMTVEKREFPDGFFVVFVLLPEDSQCNQLFGVPVPIPESNATVFRAKTIKFTIKDALSTDKYVLAIVLPVFLYFAFVFMTLFVYSYFHHLRCTMWEEDIAKEAANPSPEPPEEGTSPTPVAKRAMYKSRLRISELIIGKPERLMQQTKRYYMAGLLVASFYSMPVFQLIFSFHRQLLETGNFDLCYFNYMCSHKLGSFHDFNHLYSNAGYIICGISFIIIVFIRQHNMVILPSADDPKPPSLNSIPMGPKKGSWFPQIHYDIKNGVFVHHGLFYAMGFSLCMTGVMSTVYHICPNQSNFQFDAAFMYTTAALGVVTIYQFRHPTYVSASLTFMTLAVVAAATVIGLLWENTKFRIFFTVTHIVFLLGLLVYIHYVGYIRKNGVTVTTWGHMGAILKIKWREDIFRFKLFGLQRETWTAPGDPATVVLAGPCRLIFPFSVITVNICVMLVIWILLSESNFASQVLAVYVVNCSVYNIYYICMKLGHGECRGRLWRQPLFFLIFAFIFWTVSLAFFIDVVTLWERSPAESRVKNAPCILFEFYDSHDIWHFASAAAMFCSLMTLFTMDDDVVDKAKSEIPVF